MTCPKVSQKYKLVLEMMIDSRPKFTSSSVGYHKKCVTASRLQDTKEWPNARHAEAERWQGRLKYRNKIEIKLERGGESRQNYGRLVGDLVLEKNPKNQQSKTTAPRIPAWSPTVVLTGRHSG